MKKVCFVLIALLFCAASLRAQSLNPDLPRWKTSGVLTWGYNQTAVSKNWAGTEEFVRAWQARLNLMVEREGEKTNWNTSFKEEYGKSEIRGINAVSLDLIEFSTVFTYNIYKLLRPYASFYVLSQNNKFWDPVTYIESVGLSFVIINNAINTLRTRAGAALRQYDDSVLGNSRDIGAEAIANYTLLFHQSAKLTSEARLFETFKNGENLRWENKLFLKTGPWFTTEFGYTVFFDRLRVPAHSWPNDVETLLYVALGFSFNIFQN